jgi:gluconate 2-dehydrogenase subunit 3-like protein
MSKISRRRALELFSTVPVAAAMAWTPAEAEQAHTHAQQARAAAAKQTRSYKPKFFTAREYATVAVLVDLIIPKDERSGSATEAGVPEFMDFMMMDQPRRQVAMRGGLAMIDRMCEERFGKQFAACTEGQRREILDDIAYTENVPPARTQAVAFFSSFRDLTASGFWTTRMGVADLQYQGNVFLDEWKGCPEEALHKLGVRY